MLSAERDERRSIDFVLKPWHDNCVNHFPPARIRDTKDGGFQNRRVFVKDFFHFGAVDVFTARDNHIFDTVDEKHITLFVHPTEVARMVPAIA